MLEHHSGFVHGAHRYLTQSSSARLAGVAEFTQNKAHATSPTNHYSIKAIQTASMANSHERTVHGYLQTAPAPVCKPNTSRTHALTLTQAAGRQRYPLCVVRSLSGAVGDCLRSARVFRQARYVVYLRSRKTTLPVRTTAFSDRDSRSMLTWTHRVQIFR